MAEVEFSLPRSSYNELAKMIQAYFLASQRSKGEPVTVPDVAGQAGMNKTIVSRNNRFFASAGLIAGGQKKTLTAVGRDLGLAIDHQDDDRVRRGWAQIVAESDFLHRIVNAVRIRGGMDVSSLQTHIAITAGTPKTGEFMTGANAVIELLLLSGRLADDGGTLRVGAVPQTEDSERERVEIDSEATTIRSEESGGLVSTRMARSWQPSTTFNLPTYGLGGVTDERRSVTINVNVNLAADDPDAAVEVVRRLLALVEGERDERSSSESASEHKPE